MEKTVQHTFYKKKKKRPTRSHWRHKVGKFTQCMNVSSNLIYVTAYRTKVFSQFGSDHMCKDNKIKTFQYVILQCHRSKVRVR